MLRNWLIYRRLPWVLAAEPRDCGASVFASLARFHGHHLTLEEARGLVGTDRDGTCVDTGCNADNCGACGRRYGPFRRCPEGSTCASWAGPEFRRRVAVPSLAASP